MRSLVLILVAGLFVGCGSDGSNGKDGQNCEVIPTDTGAQIKCGDTTTDINNGTAGTNGINGTDGKDGTNGIDGEDGINGKDGLDGINGTSYDDAMQETLNIIIGNNYNQSVFNVYCTDGSFNYTATGTKISNSTILTAHHVVDGMTACSLYSNGVFVGNLDLNIISQIGSIDMVIVGTNFNSVGSSLPSVPYLTTGTFSPYIGQMLLLISHPLDLDNNRQFTFGYVTDNYISSSDLGSNSTYWEDAFTSDMVATSGSSGAPVFNEYGIIVAIHVGGYSSTNLDLNYQLPIR